MLAREAAANAAAGNPAAAAWGYFLCARLALGRGDVERAGRDLRQAVDTLGGDVEQGAGAVAAARAGLLPDLMLLRSELDAEAGDWEGAARRSLAAEAGFAAAGNVDGVAAALAARGERALRGGNLDAAGEILARLLPQVDDLGWRDASVWLRVRLAAALAPAGRYDEALLYLREALDVATPASRLAVAGEAMRIWLAAGRPAAALALGAEALDWPDPPAEHAGEVLELCAAALAALGEGELSERVAARAGGG